MSAAIDFHVACIGASAGGLESLELLFSAMPRRTGMAFIVVQHLSPDFKSLMDELLARHTSIPIKKIEDGDLIEPDYIYLMPSKKQAVVAGGRFHLTDKERDETLTLPIDRFLRTLAQEVGDKAIAVILSGSGSDGSRGIRDVHQAGGLVVCESEDTAKFDGMPLAAQESGVVDLVLRPNDIPEAMMQHISFEGDKSREQPQPTKEGIELVFGLLHEEYGIDFSHYKASTVGRRIQRRLDMGQVGSVDEYAELLRNDTAELVALYKDLLIGVTRFFRDPEAYEQLERSVVPEIVDRVKPEDEIRVWVAGCATGEEAYSIAMLFHERLKKLDRPLNIKIFATDVHQESLDIAGRGFYDAESLSEVSAERMERYFSRTRGGYDVDADLRRMIVFAPQNVIKDAPFTKLDMIACRNLLIYFQPLAQKKALSLFHFGLKTGGILMLGPSESPGEILDEFEPLDEHWKIYRKRRDVRLPTDIRYPTSPTSTRLPRSHPTSRITSPPRGAPDASLVGAYDWLLERHVPPAVLIDDEHRLLHVFGEAENFMRMRGGRPTGDALDLFSDDLRTVISGAFQRVKRSQSPVRYTAVHAGLNDQDTRLNVSVEPVKNKRAESQQFLITMQPVDDNHELHPTDASGNADVENVATGQISTDRIKTLEDDLRFTKENLQATVEELETANEELQATNEELVASNEELQSTNEELHSVNEELYTVNAEYQKKISDLTEMTADLDSLMESTEVATVFLDRELCIRKFTPQIGPVFRLMPQDTGRCIDSFAHHLDHDGLIDDIRGVLQSGEPIEKEVQDCDGRWLYMRVLPYRSKKKGEIEGVVLTLIDINALKRTQHSLADAVQDREQFLAMLSHELRNPIGALLSAAHMLDTEGADPSRKSNAVSVIKRQSEHVGRLLDDLLDVSRMTQNKIELRKRKLDLRDPLRDAAETIAPAFKRRKQELKIELPDHACHVSGDHDRLRQVFVNLLANSSKYTEPEGAIEVTMSSQESEVSVCIADDGTGISPEMLKRIFDPFVQSQRTQDQHDGGMGVGLALVKFIVEQHGGRIEATSEGVGEGADFIVSLPVDTEGASDSTQSHVTNSHQNAKNIEDENNSDRRAIRTIVLVEDLRDNREMLKSLLEMEGFEVDTANNGEEGLEAILKTRPEAALVDLGMPKMNGYELARRVRQEVGDSIYLIALTGHGQSEDRMAAHDAGFNEHLVKPVDFHKLMNLLTS